MRSALPCFALFCVVFSGQLLAGVGASSAGVSTSVGNSTDPSPDVQAQSSGFVQQNQQLQNAPGATAGTSPGSTAAVTAVLPGAANAAAGAAAPGSANAGQPGQAAAAAVPVAPPPPPPTYESTIRRLDRRNESAPTSAGVPSVATPKPEPEKTPAVTPPKPAANTAPNPAPLKPAAMARAEKPAVEAASAPTPIAGGRGEAPDGFTFFSGVMLAGALVAFALVTFLRIGRNEGA